jgi:preprotein translocase subunit SecA
VAETALKGLADGALRVYADDLRGQLRREGLRRDLVARTFALVREMAERKIGLRPFDVQLMGGWVLLNGMIVEMETGEGKTLTATLPACTLALAGVPVHIITVNDYLATRDAEWMGPIYRALGLTVGVIVHGLDPPARRKAYAADITYCTNKEIVFDYLKDRLHLGRRGGTIHLQLERLSGQSSHAENLLLRGLHYAIVDEADSVLVDEARTPLIISGRNGNRQEQSVYETALSLADQLQPDQDFLIESGARQIRMTEAGFAKVAELCRPLGSIWTGRLRREELVHQALTARHLFVRDQHYLVKEGKVQLIDEFTGRIMGDRSWEHGLHQMVEAKEGCPLTSQQDARARITYQRFFRKYLRLAGMTGTAREVRGELWSVYRLPVVSIPTNRPTQRRGFPDRVFPTAAAKWEGVVKRIEEIHQQGRPVLIGTRSVAASEHLSRLLAAVGLRHQVLNARQDKDEASIIAQAGEPKRITVATNMAGRGTDIRLAPGIAERGGLHVLATERHEARRIDRQLFGRCGRQGDSGTYAAFVSLEDEIVIQFGHPFFWVLDLTRWLGLGAISQWLGRWILGAAQRKAERVHARMRRDLLKMDEQLETTLAFSGRVD